MSRSRSGTPGRRPRLDPYRAHDETFIAPYFTTDGQADLAVGATAITTVAAEVGVPATVTETEFYPTAITTTQEPSDAGATVSSQIRAP